MQNSADGPVMTPSNVPVFLDTKDLCTITGLSVRTVQSWRLKEEKYGRNHGPEFFRPKGNHTPFGPVFYTAEAVRVWLTATNKGHLLPKLDALVAQKRGA